MAAPLDRGRLTEWSLENNGELAFYLQSLALRGMPDAYRKQLIFYIVFKCILLALGVVLVAQLIMTGRWWLFRVVRVPRGRLICPNACEALCLSACIFYLIDLIYRGFSFQWMWKTPHRQQALMLIYALRFYFLWLAGFIHAAASLLVWPLDPMRVRPLYWHILLFGYPALFLAAFLPPSIMSNTSFSRGTAQLVSLVDRLEADKQGPVSQESVDQGNLVYDELYDSWKYSRDFAAVAVAFLIPVTICTAISGSQVVWRTAKRYRHIKNAEQTHAEESGMASDSNGYAAMATPNPSAKGTPPAASTASFPPLTFSTHRPASGHVVTSSDGDGQHSTTGHWRQLSHKRRIVYLLGLGPLRKVDHVGAFRGKPTSKSVQAVLKDFMTFSIVQYGCLLLVELAMIGSGGLIFALLLPDMRSEERSARYGTPFSRTSYIYLALEIWVIVVVGSPLILLMLWRQVYPIRVNFNNDTYTRQTTQIPMNNIRRWRHHFSSMQSAAKEGAESDLTKHNDGTPSRLPSTRLTTIPTASNTTQPQRTTDKASHDPAVKLAYGQSVDRAGAQEVVILRSTPSLEGSDTSVEAEEARSSFDRFGSMQSGDNSTESMAARDACGISGSDARVRRIVLDALAAASHYPEGPRRRTSTLWQRAELEQRQQQQDQQNLLQQQQLQQQQQQQQQLQQPLASQQRRASFRKGSGFVHLTSFPRRGHAEESPPISDSARFATPHGLIEGHRYD